MYQTEIIDMWRFTIETEDYGEPYAVYLLYNNEDGARRYASVEDGVLKLNDYKAHTQLNSKDGPKPLFIMPGFDRGILMAICKGLARAGIVHPISNEQKIAAQAVSDERKEMLDYFKRLNGSLVESMRKP